MLKHLLQSLRGRLIASSLSFLVIFLGLTGYALDQAFKNSVERALKEKLKTHLYALLAAADNENNQLSMPTLLQDPEFNRIDSGRYAVITQNGKEIWRSPSAVSIDQDISAKAELGRFQLSELTLNNHIYYRFSYGIIWESEEGTETRYDLSILQSKAPTRAEISSFRNTLWIWLGGIGLVLIVTLSAILRWGLSPLPRLAKDLQQIEQGKQDQLSGSYPTELQGVADNLNLLIANERRQRQRYRNTLADLAHSLKTPLAILRGAQPAVRRNGDIDKALHLTIEEQVSRMDQIVSYQLQRATTPDTSLTVKPVNLARLSSKLLRTLDKVYAEKMVSVEVHIPAHLQFMGDERDLMEVLGNILDNAFKACHTKVSLSAQLVPQSDPHQLQVSVDDDGAGIEQASRNNIIERGVRADTSQPGQGIGLAVAVEIIRSYQGQLSIQESPLGGARFSFTLPGQ